MALVAAWPSARRRPVQSEAARAGMIDARHLRPRRPGVLPGLRADRAKLDGYVSASRWPIDGASRNEQIAFWLNAYNALVLETVIDQYPIRSAPAEYPARSIRQIPGAFERLPHRVAGRH